MHLTKSKIFLYFCLSFALGVFIASFWEIPVLALFAGAILAVILISIFWRHKRLAIAGFCFIIAILGVWRYQAANNNFKASDYNDYLEKNIVFESIITEEPDIRIKDTQYVIKTINVERQTPNYNEFLKNYSGKILITAPHYPAYQYGDLVEFEGKLKTPEKIDSFDYQEYLAKDDIYFTMYNPKTSFISSGNGNPVYSAIFRFKSVFKERLGRLLPEPKFRF